MEREAEDAVATVMAHVAIILFSHAVTHWAGILAGAVFLSFYAFAIAKAFQSDGGSV